mmetsp:Transcript_13856/g.39791  ORF Transcript_13856/g.39791 Transcript_13856/m.39791 type:complete len:234 (+) Transcript_13856:108-809(+)
MPAPLGWFVAFWSFFTRFVVSDFTPAMGAVDGAMTGIGFSGRGAFSPLSGCSSTTESLRALSVGSKCFRANFCCGGDAASWSTWLCLFAASKTCFLDGGCWTSFEGAVSSRAAFTRESSRSARDRFGGWPSLGSDSTPQGLSSNMRLVLMCCGDTSLGSMSWFVRLPLSEGFSVTMAIDGTKGACESVVRPTSPPTMASGGGGRCFFDSTRGVSGPPLPSSKASIVSPSLLLL